MASTQPGPSAQATPSAAAEAASAAALAAAAVGAPVGLARSLRGAWRMARLLLHLLHGMAVMALRFPFLNAAGRHARIAWWSRGVLRAMGVALHTQGLPRPGATLLVANHVSWLDIVALHAAVPHARFVSKADVLRWPLLGWLIRGAGTLFIERERLRDAVRVVHTMADALRDGQTVAVFPEGTTGLGQQPLPFHANLLQAAISTGTPVQPAVLRFADAQHRFSPAVTFVGQTTLAQSVWRVACAQRLCVQVVLLGPMASAHADRRALAARLRAVVVAQLHKPPSQGGSKKPTKPAQASDRKHR